MNAWVSGQIRVTWKLLEWPSGEDEAGEQFEDAARGPSQQPRDLPPAWPFVFPPSDLGLLALAILALLLEKAPSKTGCKGACVPPGLTPTPQVPETSLNGNKHASQLSELPLPKLGWTFLHGKSKSWQHHEGWIFTAQLFCPVTEARLLRGKPPSVPVP